MPTPPTTQHETGLDVARAAALTLLLVPVSVALKLVPNTRLPWLATVPPTAATLLAAILGASAYLYARTVTFPQFFTSTVVRAIVFFTLGWVLAQGRAWLQITEHPDFPIRYDLPILFAVLTLLTTVLVYAPLWVQAGLTVLASPAVPFTYDWLVTGGLNADNWLAHSVPALFDEHTGTVLQGGLGTLWCVGLGILLWRARAMLGAKLGLTVALVAVAVAALFWVNPRAQSRVLAWPTPLTVLGVAGVLYGCAELARLAGARRPLLEPFARVGRMSLSASVVMMAVAVHAGPHLVGAIASVYSNTQGAAGWDVYAYWLGFLALSWGAGAAYAGLWQKLLGSSVFARGPVEAVLALISGRR